MLPVSSCCKEIRMRNRGAKWLAYYEKGERVPIGGCSCVCKGTQSSRVRPRPPSVDTCGCRRTHSDAGTVDGHGRCCENETESTHNSYFRRKISDLWRIRRFFTKKTGFQSRCHCQGNQNYWRNANTGQRSGTVHAQNMIIAIRPGCEQDQKKTCPRFHRDHDS